jgi:hypothetical protein
MGPGKPHAWPRRLKGPRRHWVCCANERRRLVNVVGCSASRSQPNRHSLPDAVAGEIDLASPPLLNIGPLPNPLSPQHAYQPTLPLPLPHSFPLDFALVACTWELHAVPSGVAHSQSFSRPLPNAPGYIRNFPHCALTVRVPANPRAHLPPHSNHGLLDKLGAHRILGGACLFDVERTHRPPRTRAAQAPPLLLPCPAAVGGQPQCSTPGKCSRHPLARPIRSCGRPWQPGY